jgi:hypothetical protein
MIGAQAGAPFDRATGGGQIEVGTNGTGAGSTIAFNARGVDPTSTLARGEVQYIDRTGGNGQDQVIWHGTVDCLRVVSAVAPSQSDPDGTPQYANISGTWDRGDSTGPFEILVTDDGEGADAQDLITVTELDDEPGCGDEQSDEEPETELARGNVQVYDAP